MKNLTLLLASLLIALPVLAADPWGNADPKLGKEHHDKACVTCHISQQGGDGSKMYTRDNRLLSSKQAILKRTTACNAQTKAGLLPEEVAQVAAYLNLQYYHFKE